MTLRAAMTRRQGTAAPAIVMIVPDYVPALGGTTTQTRLHAAEFARRGWQVSVVTRRVPSAPPRAVVDGIPVYRVGPPSRRTIAKWPQLLCLWWWLVRRRQRISAVSVIMDPDFVLSVWASGLSASTVLTWVTQGDATKTLTGRKGDIRRHLLRHVRQVTLTQAMRAELAELTGTDSTVIAVPVDVTRFHTPTAAERADARTALNLGDSPTILSVSHLQQRKGTAHLLQAAKTLRDQGLRFTLLLVGGPVEPEDRDYVDRLEAFVNTNDLSNVVRFLGPQRDVLPYLHAADLFCLASEREGMPNVLLEAMACGVPCIAPASAGGRALLDDGVGCVPDSNAPAELADAFGSLLADAPARDRLSRRGQERVCRSHSIDAIVDEYERLVGTLRRPPNNQEQIPRSRRQTSPR